MLIGDLKPERNARKRLSPCQPWFLPIRSIHWASRYHMTSVTLGDVSRCYSLRYSLIMCCARSNIDWKSFDHRPFDLFSLSIQILFISWLIVEIMTFFFVWNYRCSYMVLVVCNPIWAVILEYSEGQCTLSCRGRPSGRRLPLSLFCVIFSKILSSLRYSINSH